MWDTTYITSLTDLEISSRCIIWRMHAVIGKSSYLWGKKKVLCVSACNYAYGHWRSVCVRLRAWFISAWCWHTLCHHLIKFKTLWLKLSSKRALDQNIPSLGPKPLNNFLQRSGALWVGTSKGMPGPFPRSRSAPGPLGSRWSVYLQLINLREAEGFSPRAWPVVNTRCRPRETIEELRCKKQLNVPGTFSQITVWMLESPNQY